MKNRIFCSTSFLVLIHTFALLFIINVAIASDERLLSSPVTVITADRIATEPENVGRSVDVRGNKEIENTKSQTLTDVVQNVSGVRMYNLGGAGAPGLTPIEVRGFPTKGTQIMLNGLTLNDPSSVSGIFDNFFNSLDVYDIERVEVLKGGAGVLYGSDSQSGVINLITKMPSDGTSVNLAFEGGSYDTFSESALINLGTERGGLIAGVSQTDSGGLDTHGNYSNTTVSLIGDYEVIPGELLVIPIFRLIKTDLDLDTSPTVNGSGELVTNQDTERNNSDARNFLVGLTTEYSPSDRIDTKGSVYFLDNDRDFFFDFDGFGSESEFKGSSLNVDLQASIHLEEIASRVTVGVEFEHQEVDTDAGGVIDSEQRDQTAFFVHDRTRFLDDNVQLGGGIRVTEISDTDKTNTSLEASSIVKIPQTESRFHASIADGFRAPTLFESKGNIVDFNTGELVTVGNGNLEEEESISWDIGIEQPLFDDSIIFDVTFFQIDADETIIFDFANNIHVNGGGGKTEGIESSLLYRPCEYAYLRAAYTHISKAEGIDGRRRQRVPRNWFTLTGVALNGPLTVSAELSYRDKQELEFFGVADRFTEDNVTLLDVTASLEINENIEIFVRGDNIFNVNYTEAGYEMSGASAYGGIKLKLG